MKCPNECSCFCCPPYSHNSCPEEDYDLPDDGRAIVRLPFDTGKSANDTFTFDTFEHGGTVDSWSVTDLTIDGIPTAGIDIVVTGTEFSAGIHFWPKDPITFNPTTFLPCLGSAISGTLSHRNWGGAYQYYSSRTSVNGIPWRNRPFPFVSLVIEQDSKLYYGPEVPIFFHECWTGFSLGAGLQFLPDGRLSGGDNLLSRPVPGGVDMHHWPEPDAPNIDRVGFAWGLTTVLQNVTFDGFSGPQSYNRDEAWPIDSSTNRERATITDWCIISSHQKACQKFFYNILSLTMTLESSGVYGVPELDGVSVSCTRILGEDTYYGSTSVAITGTNEKRLITVQQFDFYILFLGDATDPIDNDADDSAAIQTKLEAVLGVGNVLVYPVAGGSGTLSETDMVVEFIGDYENTDVTIALAYTLGTNIPYQVRGSFATIQDGGCGGSIDIDVEYKVCEGATLTLNNSSCDGCEEIEIFLSHLVYNLEHFNDSETGRIALECGPLLVTYRAHLTNIGSEMASCGMTAGSVVEFDARFTL